MNAKPTLLPDLSGLSRRYSSVRAFNTLKFAQEKAFLEQHLNANDKLRLCTSESIGNAVLQAATMGLSMNPMAQHLYLIPRRIQRDPDVWGCNAVPSYRGLIHLLVQTGVVLQFTAEVVYADDQFSYHGPMQMPTHSAVLQPNRRTLEFAIGVYTVARLADGGIQSSYTDRNQILAARSASDNSNGLMWTTFWTEGWKKTAIRRAWKTLPMSDVMFHVEQQLNVVEGGSLVDSDEPGQEVLPVSTAQVEELRLLVADADDPEKWLRRVAGRFGYEAIQSLPERDFQPAMDLLRLGMESAQKRVGEDSPLKELGESDGR